MSEPVDQTESFWRCVEVVCRRVVGSNKPGERLMYSTTMARAQQVLDQMANVKATGVAVPPESEIDFPSEPA